MGVKECSRIMQRFPLFPVMKGGNGWDRLEEKSLKDKKGGNYPLGHYNHVNIITNYDRNNVTKNGSERGVERLKNKSESLVEDGTKERQGRYNLMTRALDLSVRKVAGELSGTGNEKRGGNGSLL